MEEAPPELISPRISFSHDGVVATAGGTPPPPPTGQTIRLDMSLMSLRRLAEPEFDFANAAAADVAPADRLFAGGKLLPVPPLPPIIPKLTCSPCKQQASSSVKPQQPSSLQRRPGSWTSPFTRSCSVNSASTTTAAAAAAPRSAASGSFSCPSFPLMRSRSAGTAAAAQGGLGSIAPASGHRQQSKKASAAAAASNSACSRPAYYYGGGRNGSSGHGHGVRVSPVINVPSIGTSMLNVLSYLLCDCGNKSTKNRGFGVNC